MTTRFAARLTFAASIAALALLAGCSNGGVNSDSAAVTKDGSCCTEGKSESAACCHADKAATCSESKAATCTEAQKAAPQN